MRLWVALCLVLALPRAHAGDDLVTRLRRMAAARPPAVKWMSQTQQPTAPLAVESKTPGQIRIVRQDAGRRAYDVRVLDVQSLALDVPVRVRSTSCAGLPRNLECRFKMTYPSLTVGVFPQGQATPGRTEDYNSQRLAMSFLRKHFPELVPSPLTLECGTWDWAKNERSGRVEIIEVAGVGDREVLDLQIQQRSQGGPVGDVTCDGDPGRPCVLDDSDDHGRDTDLLYGTSIALELNKRRACTVEFEATRPPNPDNIFDLIKLSAQRTKVNPAAYARFQPRFTQEMLDDWIDAQIRELQTGERSYVDTLTQLQNVALGWLSFFNVVSPGLSSGAGTVTIDAYDKIDEGDRE